MYVYLSCCLKVLLLMDSSQVNILACYLGSREDWSSHANNIWRGTLICRVAM